MSHRHLRPFARAILPLTLATAPAFAEEPARLSDVTVEAEASDAYTIDPTHQAEPSPDVGALLNRAPGAQVNRNGSLTGIAQYRGLYGDRVNVVVDGMNINAACTNSMDPPLSHIPGAQLEKLTVIRGIAPVSSGLETMGGTIIAESRNGDFGDSDAFEQHGELSMGGASVNDAYDLSGLGWVANRNHKLYGAASREVGSDARFADGKITPTEYVRNRYSLGYAVRFGTQELAVDVGRNDTGKSGTPSLPMDITFADTHLAKVDWRGVFGEYQLHASVGYSQIDHEMDNYTLRTPPNNATRLSVTDSSGLGYKFETTFKAFDGDLKLGLDGHMASHNATIHDPVNNPNFYVDNFNDISRDRYGLFSEWSGLVGELWTMELGLRYTQVQMDAGEVRHFMYMMNPAIMALQDRFNGADRSQTDNNVDWVLQFGRPLTQQTAFVAGIARKTRSPSYQERYLWLPMQATAGLADGHNYVGDIGLNPEVSHQIELGLDWTAQRAYAAPRLFYREVSDYIQGTPATDPTVVMVSTANGDPDPLQFSNVDARLYGIDTTAGLRFGEHWSVDGVLSYVRGERDDIDDNLYRVFPLHGTLGLTHDRGRWSVTAQSRFAARQDKVSATNSETETAGYAVFDLFGNATLPGNLAFSAGVSNLFDTLYRDHTSGINRVIGSDVAVGERVPGFGRSVYARLRYSW
ncbi:MAG: TonB-dependent receptor [Nevskiales bacterium]|nr:TonB-dependent receptor [Nevskiales bacterium]